MEKRVLITLLAVLMLPLCVGAQNNDFEEYKRKRQASYDAYKTEKAEGIKAYKERANQEYARRLKERWERFNVNKAEVPAPKPEPEEPPVADPEEPQTPPKKLDDGIDPIVVTPSTLPPTKPQPKPETPVVPQGEKVESIGVEYYGTSVKIAYAPSMKGPRLRDCSEESIATLWSAYADGRTNAWLKDLFELRSRLDLCDWAFNKLVEKASVKLLGDTNEATVLHTFTLVQAGFKVRMAHQNGEMCLLYPSNITLYNYLYLMIDGQKYYILSDSKEGAIYVCDTVFPGERIPSPEITIPTLYFAIGRNHCYEFASEIHPEVVVSPHYNRHVISFLNDCPVTPVWQIYIDTSLSDELKNSIYPTLKKQIAHMSEEDAANVILGFVQTAFEYKTDAAQFGYERPLFADEMFNYDYSDCEDRAILFTILVRDLLGLDVVLMQYPAHVATAVRFTSDVKGDYVMVDKDKYIVCDPTYINAPVGMAMPKAGQLQSIITL